MNMGSLTRQMLKDIEEEAKAYPDRHKALLEAIHAHRHAVAAHANLSSYIGTLRKEEDMRSKLRPGQPQ